MNLYGIWVVQGEEEHKLGQTRPQGCSAVLLLCCCSQSWAPEPFWRPVGYVITDRRLSPVSVFFKEITETETGKFPVGYSVGYYTQMAILRNVRTPMEQKNVAFECSSVGTSAHHPY